MGRLEELEFVELPDRASWAQWLEVNHATSPGIWLAVGKKGNQRTALMYEDAVEEALRFGWIDSTLRRLDDDRTKQLFTPRRPKGNWAASNKRRVERLIAEGRMTPAGMAVIERAKADGSWSSLDDVEDLVMMPEFADSLAAMPPAAETYEHLAESRRKMILYWISSAKRQATRDARVAKAVEALAEGRSPV